MPWMALAIGGSALLGASAAKSAAKTQAASADQATQLQREMFNKQLELQQPFQEAGVNALAKMQKGVVSDYMDPSYQFRLGEGMKALERQAAARGGLISGGALKAAQRYGQDYASQEFGNAYNRLAAMAGIGQTATGAMGNAAGAFGANAGQNYMGAANARASGYVGGANALTGGLGQYLNYTQGQNLLAGLQGGGMGGNAGAATNPYFKPSAGIGSIPSGYYTGD
jgi:hypothetical protein